MLGAAESLKGLLLCRTQQSLKSHSFSNITVVALESSLLVTKMSQKVNRSEAQIKAPVHDIKIKCCTVYGSSATADFLIIEVERPNPILAIG